MPAIVVPAAGRGDRLGGRAKALLPFGGTSALGRIAETAAEAGLPPPIVVTGAHRAAVEAEAERLRVPHVFNRDWERGRTTSVQVGWRSAGDVPILLWPVDIPLPRPATVRALARREGATAAVPLVGDRRGHPVVLGRASREEVLALRPDEPLHAVVRRHARTVPLNDEGCLLDVNTPETYEAALAYLRRESSA